MGTLAVVPELPPQATCYGSTDVAGAPVCNETLDALATGVAVEGVGGEEQAALEAVLPQLRRAMDGV